MYGRVWDLGMGTYRPQVRRDLDVSRGETFAFLVLKEPQQSVNQASRVGVSAPCEAVSNRVLSVFVSRLVELFMYETFSDPWVGPYRPRVQRNLTRLSQREPLGAR